MYNRGHTEDFYQAMKQPGFDINDLATWGDKKYSTFFEYLHRSEANREVFQRVGIE